MNYDPETPAVDELRTRMYDIGRWGDKSFGGELMGWQFHVICVVLTLTQEAPIEYLSCDHHDNEGTVLAVTAGLIVQVSFTVDAEDSRRDVTIVKADAIPRTTVSGLNLLAMPKQNVFVLSPTRARYQIEFDGNREPIPFPVDGDRPSGASQTFAQSILTALSSK